MAKVTANGCHEAARVKATRVTSEGATMHVRYVLRSDGAVLSAISKVVRADGSTLPLNDGLGILTHVKPGVALNAATLRKIVEERGCKIVG